MTIITDIEKHPQWNGTCTRDANTIVVIFKVGYYVEPPEEIMNAKRRVAAIINAMESDIKLLRQWDGNVYMHSPVAQVVNPEITVEMQWDFEMTARRCYPDYAIIDTWKNKSHSLTGFSVMMTKKVDNGQITVE